MAANEKEPTKPTNEHASRATNLKTGPVMSPLAIGVAVGAAILLLLGGTAAGFFASRVIGPNWSGGGFGMMDRDDHMGGIFRSGDSRRGGHLNMVGMTLGKVTNVSDNSITLDDTRLGASVTFKIDSKTVVRSSSGDNAKVSDIKVGDTVAVRPTSATDDTTADTIVINPTWQ